MDSNSMGYTEPKLCKTCGGTHIHYWVDDNIEKCIVCVRTKTLKQRAESVRLQLTLTGGVK